MMWQHVPWRTSLHMRSSGRCRPNQPTSLPGVCALQTPMPDLSQLSPDEVLTIELFKTNTCAVEGFLLMN